MGRFFNFKGLSGIRVSFDPEVVDGNQLLTYNFSLTGNQFNEPNPVYLSAGNDLSLLRNDSNFVTANQADDKYLEKSGGTITGNLKVQDTFAIEREGHRIEQKSFVTQNIGTTTTKVAVFSRTNLKLVKYLLTIFSDSGSTSCEVLVSHNGTSVSGTVYGIVDAQNNSELDDISISLSNDEVFLNISSTDEERTAIIKGEAIYS
jgi:hypothetical protein